MSTVLIAGGTGLIGKHLSQMLAEQGHSVRHLSRKEDFSARFPAFAWDVDRGIVDEAAFKGVDHIVNLAGAGIADKAWTKARKQLIIESRVKSTLLLKAQMEKTDWKPQSYISSAAIGFYGNVPEDRWIGEDQPVGSGFLAESCDAWEGAIRALKSTGVRTVALRIGLVLTLDGGALPQLLGPLRFGVAPYMGSGQQWYAWIHIDDLCRMFVAAIENEEMKGVYNAVAPNPVRNKDFTRAIIRDWKSRALLIPAPSWALRIGLGEMADVVLSGARVSANRIMNTGFEFEYPYLENALKALSKK
jgi:uncharacterized protein (TIGR01777 family)